MSEPAAAPVQAPRTDPLRALVLAGGLTFEREVSINSGGQVVEALTRAGVEAELHDADAELLPGLSAAPADAVFIALHGATGEDGALRAVLDLAGVPYVGSPASACRLAWDKPAAKSVVRSAGVSTPDSGAISTAGSASGPSPRSMTDRASSTPSTKRSTITVSP